MYIFLNELINEKSIKLNRTFWFLKKMLHRDFLSCVEDVIDADILFLKSNSIITLFLESCSCIKITFSTPLMIKYPPYQNIDSENMIAIAKYIVVFAKIKSE